MITLALCMLTLGCQERTPPASDAPLPPGSDYEGPAFEFEEILPGIYHARGTGNLAVGSHGAVIVNDDDVLLVDSHISPAAATAILEEIEALTDKPVRYVVNTHFHFDHAHGNQIYPSDVHVIGHEFTREALEGGASLGRSYDIYVGSLPRQIEQIEAALAETTTEAERTELANRLAYLRNYHAGQDVLEPTGPNTTLSERMTLFRGDREIQILFFGRGHTGGDVVVYLPEERVVATGDLLTGGIPFMGDGYLTEWAETLEHLKALEIDWILPGHGNAYRETERIGWLQDYLRDLQAQAEGLHAQGLSAAEAADRIDMTSHGDRFGITEVGVPEITVLRIFELLDGAGDN
jgi:glyoxylase-like metal-dependent hydrolase (beta-lactamase superfamily II)